MTRLSQYWPAIERVADANGVVRLGASDLADTHAELFETWLDRGHHATMHYLAKNRDARHDPASRFPWAKSVIVILVPYSAERPEAPEGSLTNHIARYALGDDYHEVLDRILRELEGVFGEGVKTWRYVDTGPLSDRAYGAQSGLGWIARNGMLINQELGSYFFIGTLLTSLENDVAPHAVADRCGTCTRCLDACPTNAILPDRTLDSNLCISYATIEHRGPLPPDLPLAGNAFGCDICQEACPWNHDPAAAHPSFAARDEYRATPVTDLLRFEQNEFSTLFRKSAIKRAKLAGMQRNVEALFDSGVGPRESDGVTKVTLDELPAELAERIRELRDPIEIVDNEKTIAEIRPVRGGLSYMHIPDPALGPIGQYRPKPLPRPLPVSAVETLLAEREEERNRKKW